MQSGIHASKISALGGNLFSLILSIPTVNLLQPSTTSRMIISHLKWHPQVLENRTDHKNSAPGKGER